MQCLFFNHKKKQEGRQYEHYVNTLSKRIKKAD